ncbi:MAG: CoA ester lyase [Acidilobaceae archaeon]
MIRSLLYVPANSEKKIRKAPQIRADAIVFDLEDAVPEAEKDNARRLLESILSESSYREQLRSTKRVCLRVNSMYTRNFYWDILIVYNLDPIDCIIIPKAETDLSFIYKATGRTLMAIVETARGFTRIESIASSEGLDSLILGVADLALSVGGSLESYERNTYIRTKLVLAAKAYGLQAIDKVYFNIDDIEGFKREALEAKALGYNGKQVIHPNQVSIANEVFKPTREEIEWAKKVVDAYEKAIREGLGAIRLEGRLVDYVHYRLAKRILESAS